MIKHININYTKLAELEKTLAMYYFIAPYFEGKIYPSSLNMSSYNSLIENYPDIHSEIIILQTINKVNNWDLIVIDAYKDYETRNKYIAFQPRITRDLINDLSPHCRCDKCINVISMLMAEQVTIMNNSSCLRFGIKDLNIIFSTLDHLYTPANFILFRGKTILKYVKDSETIIGNDVPYVFTDDIEKRKLLDTCWFNEKLINLENVKTGLVEMIRLEYPFIKKYFIKICIFKRKGEADIILRVGCGCSPLSKDLTIINKCIKQYCQCYTCTLAFWNPFKYLLPNNLCLKKKDNFWSPEVHKKTLLVYSKIINNRSLNINSNKV